MSACSLPLSYPDRHAAAVRSNSSTMRRRPATSRVNGAAPKGRRHFSHHASLQAKLLIGGSGFYLRPSHLG
jgi:hypothetical protein